MSTDVAPFAEPVAIIPLPARPRTLDLTNNGEFLVVSMDFVPHGEDAIRVFSVPDGELLASTSPRSSRGAAFVDDGNAIAFLRQLDTPGVALEKLAWRTNAPATDLGTSPLSVQSLTRSRSGQLLAITGTDVEVFSLAEDRTIRFINGDGEAESVVACFSYDERSIYLAQLEKGQLVQQDLRSGEELARWRIAPANGGSLSVSASGRFIASQNARAAHLFDRDRPMYVDGAWLFEDRVATVPLFAGDESFVALHALGSPRPLDLYSESGYLHRTKGPYRGLNTVGARAYDSEVYAWSSEARQGRWQVLVYRR